MSFTLVASAIRGVSYIDPGTGSMLFTLLVGLLSASYFFVRKLVIKARFALSGGRVEKNAERMPIVIFSDDKRYWNVFGSVCDELERRGQEATFWTASPDDPALEQDYEHVTCEFIGEGNKAFARLNMMSADVCLSTTPGLQVYQWKRSDEVGLYAHVLHMVDSAATYRMFGLDFYDAVLFTGEFQVGEERELERMRELPPKDLRVVGCTYMDALAKRASSEGIPAHEGRTVLLAPSWGQSAILSKYGHEIIDALVATGWHVVVRPHPQSMKSEREMMDELMASYPDGEAVEWNFDNDNFDCLSRADVMVSDFSGVVYDYALVFDGPVIYAEGQFDPSEYDAWWFDEPLRKFDHYKMMGIPLTRDQLPRMGEVLEEALADETLAAGRDAVRDEVWQHRGQAASLIADYLIEQQQRIAQAEQGNEDQATQ